MTTVTLTRLGVPGGGHLAPRPPGARLNVEEKGLQKEEGSHYGGRTVDRICISIRFRAARRFSRSSGDTSEQ